ncbi:Bug family tripartite tricarboxylate transporter substrate binding protein [Cupriavidus consociatus]|uniref:Bug family tripartite tricarboxylate transporter substrate binding protein n=1 Tax=Cupriavidus consociatus TaxID=2821357 RepID=UPI001AE53FE2|nr:MULTISPECIES: tripartite tricarboxylate transporter substrate-binding protein [unclassified Cupriavidus]MBP0624064.1 tripartite tricarboxylate transporter substrate binding protein [Cupriavidus sp. LEh25]MDK2660773.1 tripartite tricarboxylate transporter substrate-binding protein [Cupriavidus sp. LEh21]
MAFVRRVFRLAVVALLFASGAAFAQKETGKLIVGYPSGQSVDVVARLLAHRLGPAIGRLLIVENMPGQSGSLALAAVARMPADGSVMTLSASAALAGNPSMYRNLRYDTTKDFEPIGLVYDAPLLLMVNSALPIHSLKELIAYVKANAGKVNYSSPGNGSVSHLAMSELLRRTGMEMTHVPYPGSAKSLTDLAAGEVQVAFDAVAGAQPYLASGKVRAIAVSSRERLTTLPSVPTVAESGVGMDDFDMVPWVGMLAPAGTPKPVVDKLSAELARIVQSPELTERIAALGGRPRSSTAAEFRTFLRGEMGRWAAVVKASGARVE